MPYWYEEEFYESGPGQRLVVGDWNIGSAD